MYKNTCRIYPQLPLAGYIPARPGQPVSKKAAGGGREERGEAVPTKVGEALDPNEESFIFAAPGRGREGLWYGSCLGAGRQARGGRKIQDARRHNISGEGPFVESCKKAGRATVPADGRKARGFVCNTLTINNLAAYIANLHLARHFSDDQEFLKTFWPGKPLRRNLRVCKKVN